MQFILNFSKTIISKKLHWPNGLTIDRPASRLYWNDAKLGNIETSDLEGEDRKLILSNLPHPYGLVVVGNHVYWTDWQSEALHRADKNTGEGFLDPHFIFFINFQNFLFSNYCYSFLFVSLIHIFHISQFYICEYYGHFY